MRDGQLTNAAYVLYAKSGNVDYPQCPLRMARFAGKTKEVFIDNRQVEGNAFRMLEEAMQFCFKHMSLSGEVKGLIREERLSNMTGNRKPCSEKNWTAKTWWSTASCGTPPVKTISSIART